MTTSKAISRIALSFAIATGFVGADLVVAPQAALAAQKAPTVSPKVGKPLQDAQALGKQKKFKEAIAKAQEAVAVSGKTPYETYMTNEILGGLYIQTQDYGNAAKVLEASLATGQMSPEEQTQRLKMLIQVYYSNKSYPKTVEVANQYLKQVPNDVDTMVLVSQSYYLQKDFKKSSDALRSLVKAADAAGKPVKEDWLQLLMSSEYEQQNSAGVQQTLEQLVNRYNKPNYWKDLISLNERNLKGGTTKTSLDLYVVKFNSGIVTSAAEYTEMTELSLQEGLPGLAKKVMEKGMAAGVLGQGAAKEREGRLLTMSTTQADADMKALEKGVTEARKLKTGDALVKFGEAYWSYGQNDQAIALIEEGIAKGVQNADDAKLRLGIAYISAGKRPQALEAFKGITPASISAQLATLWRLHKNAAA